MSERKRMGAILVENGVLWQEAVEDILNQQAESHRPFGVLTRELYGISEREIWKAYAEQMAPFFPKVEMTTEQRDESVADAITIRDAWAHHVLPLRTEGSAMICATTEQHLPEAMAYAYTKLDRYAQFVLTEEHQLEHFIMQLFAKAGEKSESTETPEAVSNEA